MLSVDGLEKLDFANLSSSGFNGKVDLFFCREFSGLRFCPGSPDYDLFWHGRDLTCSSLSWVWCPNSVLYATKY